MTQTHVTALPDEVLLQIFHMLPPTDLNKVMLVCREWMSIGETCSTLWTWVRARTLKNRGDLPMLQTKRLKLKETRVTGCNEWKEYGQLPELFQALLPIDTLTTIHGLKREKS